MNERIRLLRKTLGLTLEKFGERIGVTRAAIGNVENGNRNVTDQMFKSICREFNISQNWLKDGTGEMFNEYNDDTATLVSDLLEEPDNEFYQAILELIRTYKQLSPVSQEILLEFGKKYLENLKNREH